MKRRGSAKVGVSTSNDRPPEPTSSHFAPGYRTDSPASARKGNAARLSGSTGMAMSVWMGLETMMMRPVSGASSSGVREEGERDDGAETG